MRRYVENLVLSEVMKLPLKRWSPVFRETEEWVVFLGFQATTQRGSVLALYRCDWNSEVVIPLHQSAYFLTIDREEPIVRFEWSGLRWFSRRTPLAQLYHELYRMNSVHAVWEAKCREIERRFTQGEFARLASKF